MSTVPTCAGEYYHKFFTLSVMHTNECIDYESSSLHNACTASVLYLFLREPDDELVAVQSSRRR